MISRAQYAAPTMNAITTRTRRVGRVVGRAVGRVVGRAVNRNASAAASAAARSNLYRHLFSITATHINCYIYITIVCTRTRYVRIIGARLINQ